MPSTAPRPDGTAFEIARQLQDIDPTSLQIWSDLDELSTHTVVEAMEVPVDGIIMSPDGRFTAVVNVYVLLQYGKDDDEGFTTSDSFRATVSGRFVDGDAIVDRSTVDTSSFYE